MQMQIFQVEAQKADTSLDVMQRGRVAKSAEHLVCSDVLERGYDALIAAEGLAYDVIADIGGLCRIQVKSTFLRSRPVVSSGKNYGYSVYRFKSKENMREKYLGRVDLLALVALDLKRIVYVRPENVESEVRFNADRLTVEYCDLSWAEAVTGWETRK